MSRIHQTSTRHGIAIAFLFDLVVGPQQAHLETDLLADCAFGNGYFTTDEIGIRGTMRHDINCHALGNDTMADAIVGLVGN